MPAPQLGRLDPLRADRHLSLKLVGVTYDRKTKERACAIEEL